jgi:predicted nucleic acid-binding protein
LTNRKRIYFDASAYVKAFTNEDGSDHAKRILELAQDSANESFQILLSVWTINETIAAIDQKGNQHHEITQEQATNIIATILEKTKTYYERTSNIGFVLLNVDSIRDSSVFIHTLHVSSDDALHLYQAWSNDCEYFVCKDKELKRKVGNNIPDLKIVDITNSVEINDLLHALGTS